jgi:hypothetical protein
LNANVFYDGLIKSSGINAYCIFSPNSNVVTLDVTGACVNEQAGFRMSIRIDLKKWFEMARFLHYYGAIWVPNYE